MEDNEKASLSKQIVPETVLARSYIWKMAAELTEPVIEAYGLETYKSSPPLGLLANYITTSTPVDQHIDHIMRVADWLLDKD